MIVGGLKCFILSDGDVREENAPLPQHMVHGQILECANHFTSGLRCQTSREVGAHPLQLNLSTKFLL